MKNKLLLILISALILIVSSFIVSASDFTFIAGDPIDLNIDCFVNKNACPNTTACNLSITYPNGSVLLSNGIMSYNTRYFNRTLNPLNVTGIYKGSMNCVLSGTNAYTLFTFEIVRISASKSAFLLAMVILWIGMCALGIFFGIFWIFSALLGVFLGIIGISEYSFTVGLIFIICNAIVFLMGWYRMVDSE